MRVSPAGWTVAAMREALDRDKPFPRAAAGTTLGTKQLLARTVPNPVTRPEFLAHPRRLRRASAITHYAASATLRSRRHLQNTGFQKTRAWASSPACNPVACNTPAASLTRPCTQPRHRQPLLLSPETGLCGPCQPCGQRVDEETLPWLLLWLA